MQSSRDQKQQAEKQEKCKDKKKDDQKNQASREDKLIQNEEEKQTNKKQAMKAQQHIRKGEAEDIEMEKLDKQEIQRQRKHKKHKDKGRRKNLSKDGSSLNSSMQGRKALFKIKKFKDCQPQQQKNIKLGFSQLIKQNARDKICEACFQVVLFPETQQEIDEGISELLKNYEECKSLYNICFCWKCLVPAHFNCLGFKQELIEYGDKEDQTFFYLCDSCQFKEENENSKGPKCFACDHKGGLLKKNSIKSKDNQQQEIVKDYFYHQICAFSLPHYFTFSEWKSNGFKLNAKGMEDMQKNKNNKQKCSFCKKSYGLFLECKNKSCTTVSHGYCAMLHYKNFQFDTNDNNEQQSSKDIWSLQIQRDMKTGKYHLTSLCQEHNEIQFCICRSPQEGNMVMCDCCQVWYHQECLRNVQINDVKDPDIKYICIKCVDWREQFTSVLSDIVFRKKQSHELVKKEMQKWDFDLIKYAKENTYLVEQKFFEMLVLIKAWTVLSFYIKIEKCTQKLIYNHQELSQQFYFNLSSIQNKLDNEKIKKKKKLEIDKKELEELQKIRFLDEFDKEFNVINLNVQINSKNFAKLEPYKESIQGLNWRDGGESKISMLIDQYEIQKDIHNKFIDFKKKDFKITMEQLEIFIKKLSESEMEDFQIYRFLAELYNQGTIFTQKLVKFISEKCVFQEEIKLQLEKLKTDYQFESLVEKRYAYFKQQLTQKHTIQDFQQKIQESNKLKLDLHEQDKEMQNYIDQINNWEKQIDKIKQSKEKTVPKLYEQLVKALKYPVQSQNIEHILELYKKSGIFYEKVKSFNKDKLSEEEMEIDEGKKNYLWTVEKAQELLEEIKNNYDELAYDEALVKEAKEKLEYIKGLKSQNDSVLQKNHEINKLKEYKQCMEEIQNVDFSNEIEKVEKKINLIQSISNTLQNDRKNKYNIEDLEYLQSQINTAKQDKNFQLPFDMMKMFQSKFQLAKDIKSEFQQIMSDNSDKFSKTMQAELKKVIQKANKDLYLDMKYEQRILDNLQVSEDWFVQTFEKLKKIGGKGLHQIDFKDFLQLYQVIPNEKECEQLLKYHKPENLVGAAKNMWKALSGVKWIFEVKRFIESPQKDIQRIQQLSQKAAELQINVAQIKEEDNLKEIFEFQKFKDFAKEYDQKFGNYSKCLKTLEKFQGDFEKLLEDIDFYEGKLKELQGANQSNELLVLQKMRTYTKFSLDFSQNQFNNKISQEKAMKLQQIAKEKQIPDDIPILRILQQSVAKFDSFQKEYTEYKRFREKMKQVEKNNNQSFSQVNMMFTKYSMAFIKRLLDQAQKIEIEMTPDYFSIDKIKEEIEFYQKWRVEALDLITDLEQDEEQISNEKLYARFIEIKKQISLLPVFDKEIIIKLKAFDWLFTTTKYLDNNVPGESMSIGSWETLIKQSEELAQQFEDIKNHSVYQKLLWEVEQAREITDFVKAQRSLQKTQNAKFSTEKSHNYAFFKTKINSRKIYKMHDSAKKSKIDLGEEYKYLNEWISDYEKYKKESEAGDIHKLHTYDELKDICKKMYLSPVEYGSFYYDLRKRLDLADQIKQNIKAVLSEHEINEAQRQIDKKKAKKLRYSRVSQDIRQFKKECKIQGIKDIELIIQKIENSRKKLQEIQTILEETEDSNINDKQVILDKLKNVRQLQSEMDIDMEAKELDIHRLIFENEVTLLVHPEFNTVMALEEFKELENKYDLIKNFLQNEKLHASFLDVRNIVHEYLRKINKIEQKEQLQDIENELKQKKLKVDFSQLIIDKNAEFLLGKRSNIKIKESKRKETTSDEEGGLGFVLDSKPQKNKPVSQKVKFEKSSSNNESDSSSESSDSSGSGSSSSNSSSSGSSNSESESNSQSQNESSGEENANEDEEEEEENSVDSSQQSQIVKIQNSNSSNSRKSSSSTSNQINFEEEEEESSNQNKNESSAQSQSQKSSSSGSSSNKSDKILQKRPKRTIVPNINSDFIYESKIPKKIQKSRNEKSSSKENEQSEESEKEIQIETQNPKPKKQTDKKEKKRIYKQMRKKKEREEREGSAENQNDNESSFIRQSKKEKEAFKSQLQGQGLSVQEINIQLSLKNMKIQKRDQTRNKLKSLFQEIQNAFPAFSKETISFLVENLEGSIYKKNPNVDHFYMKKMNDILENVKSLIQNKDVAELILVKKTISYDKLYQNYHTFIETIQTINKNIQERRQQQKNLQKQKTQEEKKQQQQQLMKMKKFQNEDDVIIPEQQALYQVVYGSNNRISKPIQQQEKQIIVKTISDDDDEQMISDGVFDSSDEESLQSMGDYQNQAKFSDNEEEVKKNDQNAEMNMEYDPTQVMHITKDAKSRYNTQSWKGEYKKNMQKFTEYNPENIMQKNKKTFNNIILYNPLKNRNVNSGQVKIKNQAPIGSLLKLWEGSLEIIKDTSFQAQFFSTQDIQFFQSLPELQATLPIRGKATISDVLSHFRRLKGDKRLIKGWVTRKNLMDQENNDLYIRLFEDLDSTQRVALFQAYDQINFYIIPVNQATKDFIYEMDIHPEFLPVNTKQDNNINKNCLLYQETHCFVVLSHIKQVFNNQINFWNPQVIEQREKGKIYWTQRKASKEPIQIFSPITSDEDKPKNAHKNAILQRVKQEEQQMRHIKEISEQTPLPQIKKQEELNIDEMIESCKNLDYNTIQQLLLPIIHNVNPEQEKKLTAFLSELIQKKSVEAQHSQQYMQNQQYPVKQEDLPFQQQQYIQQSYGGGTQAFNQSYTNQYSSAQPQFMNPTIQMQQIGGRNNMQGYPVQQQQFPFQHNYIGLQQQPISQTFGQTQQQPLNYQGQLTQEQQYYLLQQQMMGNNSQTQLRGNQPQPQAQPNILYQQVIQNIQGQKNNQQQQQQQYRGRRNQ